MKLSVVIPAYNEEGCIEETIRQLFQALGSAGIEHEILVVNDNSGDNTLKILEVLKRQYPTLRYITNEAPNGFGYAVRKGLANFTGDCAAVFMADLSDDPNDLVSFYRLMEKGGCDAVFGTRWSKGGKVHDYPKHKLWLNRLANHIIRLLFGIKYNDATNAFKLYKRTTIEGLQPFLSPHFNLTIELPLKVIIRGYSYEALPNRWTNRKTGESKLKIREMGTRYFFILLYCLIEKYFSRGDFKKKW
ncbi:MAG: glycosyltransferase family 2 protein [Dysgonamonadaceae bacterium]|jgi:dolichol-phosphate mannosyltransferase|nr:glycosyltransferase family 2 protein [Dysgonamonadaceae bacterium]